MAFSIKSEFPLGLALAVGAAGFALEHALLGSGLTVIALGLLALVSVIMGCAFRVAHHADVLAHHFGEPYGTMILTTAAVTVEVVMLIILMSGGSNPTLARDTVYSAVMLDLNGILGLAAILGGLRHGEQRYNMDASNSYVAMLLVALGLSMFIPDFIAPQAWKAYSIFTIITMVLLYAAFLRLQTVEHRYFFRYGKPPKIKAGSAREASVARSVFLLIVSIVIIGALSELLSVFFDNAARDSGFSKAVPALLIAVVSASPEVLVALRAARRDQMQTVINIALGAALATVLLTVPVIEAIALVRGLPIEMGLTPLQTAMLLLTLLAAVINLHDGQSNMLEGAVHFALFAGFVMLSFITV
jgi:Ca2+:H+ antiporter